LREIVVGKDEIKSIKVSVSMLYAKDFFHMTGEDLQGIDFSKREKLFR